MVCFKIIYNWLYQELLDYPLSTLRRKGKSRQPIEKRGKFTIGPPISKRLKEVKTRETVDHWELDTVVSFRGQSKGCLATFIKRKIWFYCAFKISDRSTKFACYPLLEREGIDFYFANAYFSWKRESNENTNGSLREYFSKKTDLAKIHQSRLEAALDAINHRPRKCIDYKTVFEALMEEF